MELERQKDLLGDMGFLDFRLWEYRTDRINFYCFKTPPPINGPLGCPSALAYTEPMSSRVHRSSEQSGLSWSSLELTAHSRRLKKKKKFTPK